MPSPARKTTPRKPTATPARKTSGTTAGRKAAPPAPVKADKAKKPKMVRDSFTFPKDEYAELALLKQRATKLTHPIKKGELLRAGIKVLSALPDAAFLQALRVVPSIKTGRPKKS